MALGQSGVPEPGSFGGMQKSLKIALYDRDCGLAAALQPPGKPRVPAVAAGAKRDEPGIAFLNA